MAEGFFSVSQELKFIFNSNQPFFKETKEITSSIDQLLCRQTAFDKGLPQNLKDSGNLNKITQGNSMFCRKNLETQENANL